APCAGVGAAGVTGAALAPPVSASAPDAGAPTQAVAPSMHSSVLVRADRRICFARLRGELTGSRCQRLRLDQAGPFAPAGSLQAAPHWVPRLPRPGPQELGVGRSIHMRAEGKPLSLSTRAARPSPRS